MLTRISTDEAAKIFSVSKPVLIKLVESGTLPIGMAVRDGENKRRTVVIYKELIDKFEREINECGKLVDNYVDIFFPSEPEKPADLQNALNRSKTLLNDKSKREKDKEERSKEERDKEKSNNVNNNIGPSVASAKEKPRHKYGLYNNVLLTDIEVEKLKARFGGEWTTKVDELSEGIALHGYVYKSHYLAILVWERRDAKKAAKPVIKKTGFQNFTERKDDLNATVFGGDNG